jgi:spore maturation protein CgeB
MPGAQALKRALSYAKFKGSGPYRLLVPLTGYHLQRECAAALRALGHTAIEVPLHKLSCADTLRVLLGQLVATRPDGLLVINHLGFDDGGQLAAVLEACQMPVACWYCDSPFFVLKGQSLPAAATTSLFVWEKSYIPHLAAFGAQDVHHLPLGCDLRQFDGASQAAATYALSFVGDSMRDACAQWDGRLGAQEKIWRDRWLGALSHEARRCLADTVASLQQQLPELQLWDALGAATFLATQRYRDGLLRHLPPSDLHVFGDAGWRHTLGGGDVTLHGSVGYGEALAQVYGQTAVSINATSLQMPTTVNQRVFDIPQAGGFVLTDDQEDLHALFEVGHEVVTYQDGRQLADLAAFYRRRPELRRQITARAQRRIRACHTYPHRLQTILSTLKQRFG